MIRVNHLVKEYTIDDKVFRAVDRCSFQVEKGEIYGIIGLSGAGKSTMVRCINRLEEPTEGSIFVDGINILSLNRKELLEKRKEIGMIFQSFHLFHQMTVYENIAYPLKLAHYPKADIDKRVMELLEFIDLVEKKNAYPAEISGGQKQRVAIARAIANKPKVLLSDEGTSALDPANTKQILDLIRKIVKEYDMTVIMITHQMEVAKDICDRIAVMENGKIVEENTVEELFQNPKNPITISFIESLKEQRDVKLDGKDFKGTLVRLIYGPHQATNPLISQCIREFNVDINIISGNINTLSTSKVGYLMVEFLGTREDIFEALDFFEENNINTEVL
ncbi:MAG: ATP-binding cassette domain-containing protein [Tissierellia bacterium]|nr:ATP-binding cassette domain-containing protein [Tissierellia bacterium]